MSLPLPDPPPQARVLLVDDLPENLFALQQILKREPYAVDAAQSAEQALRLMLEYEYACVLCDVQMPGIDGLEFIRIVRDDPDLHHVPITFLTAHGRDPRITEEAFRHDAFDFVTKPVEPEVVRSKVRVFAQLQEQRLKLKEQAEQSLRDQRTLEVLNRKLAQSNETLEQYAYLASHDLREPLRKLSAFCEILREDHVANLDDDGVACVEFIAHSAGRMRSLVDDMLRLARLDIGTPKWTRCALDQVMDAVIEDLADETSRTDVRIDLGPLPVVRSDHGWLRQLFVNLVGNAIRYRSSKEPHVRITSEQAEGGTVVRVADNGIGISEEDQTAIFDAFWSLHPTCNESRGLGLSIARRIAGRLGVTLTVDSQLGVGSTFSVGFPQADLLR
ncbi:MAG: response regulator [Myxococcota bacterium]